MQKAWDFESSFGILRFYLLPAANTISTTQGHMGFLCSVFGFGKYESVE